MSLEQNPEGRVELQVVNLLLSNLVLVLNILPQLPLVVLVPDVFCGSVKSSLKQQGSD